MYTVLKHTAHLSGPVLVACTICACGGEAATRRAGCVGADCVSASSGLGIGGGISSDVNEFRRRIGDRFSVFSCSVLMPLILCITLVNSVTAAGELLPPLPPSARVPCWPCCCCRCCCEDAEAATCDVCTEDAFAAAVYDFVPFLVGEGCCASCCC